MSTLILNMLEKYNCSSRQDYENAIKEIIQEIALLGLWRSKFFEVAAFYGGTALRILYGLDRFSEDLDFSLLTPNPHFQLSRYNEAIEAELQSAGLKVTVNSKEKQKDSNIQSAFIKANTLEQLILIRADASLHTGIHKDQTFRIKMEIDVNPPSGFLTEAKSLLNPIPFNVLTYQKPDLFAGKLHALLCRPWVKRVKGRDWYDLVWYIANKVPVRLSHLQERLLQSGFLKDKESFNRNILLNKLQDKIKEVDFQTAKEDILPFIKEPAAVALWSPEFFMDLISQIQIINEG